MKFLAERALILNRIRNYFISCGFLEVETPLLVRSPGMEPSLEAFRTRFTPLGNAPSVDLFLPTSPEFHMKRLLADGYTRIYQITRAFRNEELGPLHNPEFTILEWYRAGCGYETIMDDCEALVRAAADAISEIPAPRTIWRADREIDLDKPWERLTVREAWLRYTGIDLERGMDAESLREAGRALHIPDLRPGDPWDVLYFKIFLARIEPNLGWDRPLILYEYPAGMAALARLKPGAPGVALRFEIYIAGIELGNAFDELTDADEQRVRFDRAADEKRAMGREPFPVDEAFIDALRRGIPPSSGIAIGIDRLVLLLTGAPTIRDVMAFGFLE